VATGTDDSEDVDDFWPKLGGRVVRWLLLTLLLWFGAVAYLVYVAQGHARNGEAALRSVGDLVEAEDLATIDLAAAEINLRQGQEELGAARSAIDSPIVRAMGFVPVVGRQLSSARALIHTSHDVAGLLLPIVESANEARNDPNALDRVAFLQTTSEQLGALEANLAAADLGPTENLIGPLLDGRAELEEQLGDLATQTADYRIITSGLALFLDGSNYLVLGANNAEMRIATGMYLSVGSLTVADGEFDLPDLTPSQDLFPVEGVDVIDKDVADRWGFLSPSNDFRKLGYSARFDAFAGPQAVAMWEATTGETMDGAIALDPFVLDALLDVLGPVEVEGEIFDSGRALSYLLQDQYAEFESEERDERRDRLSVLAAAVVAKIGSSAWDPIELISALRPLAKGRHILVYSSDPAQQAAWSKLGVDGSMNGDETGVFLLNLGGSKLDPFVGVSVAATSIIDGAGRVVTFEVTINNRAPEFGLPDYTVGPWESLELPVAGSYSGRLAVYAPGVATEASFDTGESFVAFGPDGPLLLGASESFIVGPGQEKRLRYSYRIPLALEQLTVVPSARFPATSWTWNDRSFNDIVIYEMPLNEGG